MGSLNPLQIFAVKANFSNKTIQENNNWLWIVKPSHKLLQRAICLPLIVGSSRSSMTISPSRQVAIATLGFQRWRTGIWGPRYSHNLAQVQIISLEPRNCPLIALQTWWGNSSCNRKTISTLKWPKCNHKIMKATLTKPTYLNILKIHV